MSIEKIYQRIAKEHNTTEEAVKREIEAAIEQAWSNPDKTEKNVVMQKKVSPNGKIPKLEDVVRVLAEESMLRK